MPKKAHEKAIETGDTEAIDKFSRRLVKVTREHNDDCKTLLRLMGVPYIEVCDQLCESMLMFRHRRKPKLNALH